MYLQLVDPSLGFHGVQGSKAFPLTQVVVPQVEAGANGRSMEDLSKESPSSYLIDCLLAVAAGTAGSAFAQPSVSWPHASHSVSWPYASHWLYHGLKSQACVRPKAGERAGAHVLAVPYESFSPAQGHGVYGMVRACRHGRAPQAGPGC